MSQTKALVGKKIKSKSPYVGALVASTIIAVLGLLKILGCFSDDNLVALNKIPFFEYDLGWVVPSIIGFLIGLVYDKVQTK